MDLPVAVPPSSARPKKRAAKTDDAAPAVTPTLIATPAPDVTLEPIVTPAPDVTPEPIVTPAPALTPEPIVTPALSATSEPIVALESTVTPEPTVSASSTVVDELSVAPVSLAPEHALKPEMEAGVEMDEIDESDESGEPALVQEPRFWEDDGWTARVVKNEDDEGWAVTMTLDGEPEPALVGPWTMGRDKKNPKPMDANAFSTLVKTAYEVRRRHEQQLHAMLHKSVTVDGEGGRVKVTLDIVPDEYDPHAFLRASDDIGELIAEVRVEAGFKLNAKSAQSWISNEYRRPGGGY